MHNINTYIYHFSSFFIFFFFFFSFFVFFFIFFFYYFSFFILLIFFIFFLCFLFSSFFFSFHFLFLYLLSWSTVHIHTITLIQFVIQQRGTGQNLITIFIGLFGIIQMSITMVHLSPHPSISGEKDPMHSGQSRTLQNDLQSKVRPLLVWPVGLKTSVVFEVDIWNCSNPSKLLALLPLLSLFFWWCRCSA